MKKWKNTFFLLAVAIILIVVGWNDYVPFIPSFVFYILAFIVMIFCMLTAFVNYFLDAMYYHVDE
jgi:hypothetical protein